jgi:hypothetical protein
MLLICELSEVMQESKTMAEEKIDSALGAKVLAGSG